MKILVVDDDASVRFALTESLGTEGYEVAAVGSAEDALARLRSDPPEIALVDYHLPGMSGIDLLGIIKNEFAWIEVVIITAHGSESVAVEAIRKGAYDYVAKPFDSLELHNRLRHVRERLLRGNAVFEAEFGHYLSPAMKSMVERLRTVAGTDIPVLITGESGTGKELLARLCHHHSGRKGKLVAVNCSAIPATLFESELFGSERGAYTGASRDKQGFFERADGGTIFLDEIGELPFQMQAKLLRVLENGEVHRVGGTRPVMVNARVVAATNRDIEDETGNGRFRADLFYRLSAVHFTLPPLRQRAGELEMLAEVFVAELGAKYRKACKGLGPAAREELHGYPWPGNIRELKNRLETQVVLGEGGWIHTLGVKAGGAPEPGSAPAEAPPGNDGREAATGVGGDGDLPLSLDGLPGNLVRAKKKVVERFERQFIIHHLQRNDWNVSRTAARIGLARQDLYKKMARVGIRKKIEYH